MPYENGGGKRRVIVGCHNNQKRLYDWKKALWDEYAGLKHEDCPCLQLFSMHYIPKDEERRRARIPAINRKDFDPKTKDQVFYEFNLYTVVKWC